jgi:predicted nucleotidyltransferase
MTKTLSAIPRERIDDFCRRWKISTMSMPQARDEEQDLGVFVRFDADAEWNLTDRLRMQRELQQLSGRGVQLLHRPAMRGGYRLSVIYDA